MLKTHKINEEVTWKITRNYKIDRNKTSVDGRKMYQLEIPEIEKVVIEIKGNTKTTQL